MTSAQVQSVELGVIVLQLATISPALAYVKAGIAKLLLHFALEKTPAPPAPEAK